jgi:hypothetical protein
MAKMIELTAIDLDKEGQQAYHNVVALDDLERPVATPADPDTDPYFPITVNVDDVREYYPRHGQVNGRPRIGTRIVYMNGAARPVKETYDEVKAKFASVNN